MLEHDWPLPGEWTLPFRERRKHAITQSIQFQRVCKHAVRRPAHWRRLLLRHRLSNIYRHRRTVRLEAAAGILYAIPTVRKPRFRHLYRILWRPLRARIRALHPAAKQRHRRQLGDRPEDQPRGARHQQRLVRPGHPRESLYPVQLQ